MTLISPLPGGGSSEVPETVVSIQEIVVHQHKAKARTIERWREKAALNAIRDSFGPELQELEAVLWDIMVARWVNYAVGVQLDKLGAKVGEAREGRIDSVYRVWIKARIRINSSLGRALDLEEVLALIETQGYLLREIFPASISVEFEDVPDVAARDLADALIQTKGAGIGLRVSDPLGPVAGTFAFKQVGEASDPDRSAGWHATPGLGGRLGASYW